MTKRYDTYKDSGVQWLGEIPGHWETVRAKYLFKKEQRPVLNGDEIVTCFRDGEVTLRKNRRTSGFTEATDYSHYQHICKGDLVIHQMDAFAGSSGVSDSDGMGTPVLSVCSSKTNLTNHFYYAHILRLMGWNGFILSLYRGIRERSSDFRFDTFAKQFLPLPPLPEQHAIVSYLDDKCGKIDEWIEKKQKEVELLGEMKQRVIADAVTRGLNPNVTMKPTNIPWLPEVPEHWEIKTLRNFLTMYAEKGHGDKQLLSVTREQGVIVRNTDSKEENHNFIPEDLSNYKYVQEGDFVINKMKSWQGSYGVSEHEGIVSPAYFTCRLSGVDKTFFSTAIRSKVYISFFGRYSKGIRVDQWDLSPIGLKSIPFLLPPIEEQKQIVSYITERTAKIDKMVENVNKEIENLKEYKQRLISDVVTGQIKVC